MLEGHLSTRAIHEATDVSPRHVNYAVHALKVLSLLGVDGRLSPVGERLAQLPFGYEVLSIFKELVQGCEWLQYLAPGLGTSAFAASRDELVSRILDLSGYSEITSRRRASTLVSWHDQLHGITLPLPLQESRRTMRIDFIRPLGEGAYGRVWLGQDQLDRRVAVKFLNEDVRPHHDLIADARALSKLDHPNVIRVYFADKIIPPGDTSPRDAVVMEYVEAEPLSELLERGILEGDLVQRIGLGVIDGLQALHRAGVVHEDLHPGNVLVSETHVKLIDPYYQRSLRDDTDSGRSRRVEADIRGLKDVLSQIARRSACAFEEWTATIAPLGRADTLDGVEEVFRGYLSRAQLRQDLRPQREYVAIPLPGRSRSAANTRFLADLGFSADPFYSTNAANEDRLETYFIRPKYFRTLQGDADRPASAVVFAPRGSGKTAQALMLAAHAQEVGLLPILYDAFPGLTKCTNATPSLEYHLTNVVRHGLSILLAYMDALAIPFSALGALAEAAGSAAYHYVRKLDTQELKTIRLNPYLRNVEDGLWDELLASGTRPGEFLFRRWVDKGLLLRPADRDGLEPHQAYETLVALARRLEFIGIAVLVDKVDEAPFSDNRADRAYRLVESLLGTLALFEDKYVGWKVFLWEHCREHFVAKARSDRIPSFALDWTDNELRRMIQARLMAYSAGAITNLNQLATEDAALPINDWPFVFGNRSPRNLIRILQLAVRHEIERAGPDGRVTVQGLEAGIRSFAELHAKDTAHERHLQLLRRIGSVSLTIPQVRAELKVSNATARSRVIKLVDAGVIQQAGTIRTDRDVKSANYYLIREPSVVAYVCPNLEIEALISDHRVVCQQCGGSFFTAQEQRLDDPTCPQCGIAVYDEDDEDDGDD